VSYPPGPQDPYGSPQQQPYGYPQQQPAQPPNQQPYGYPQQQPAQQPYGYPQQGYDPNAAYGYPQGMPAQGTAQAHNGYVNVPFLGTVQVASMGQRFLARLLDGVVTGIVILIAMFAGLASAMGMHGTDATGDSPDGGFGLIFAFMGIFSGFALLYEWLMIAFLGQTLGKMAVGLKVVKERDGQNPGLGSGFVRFIIPIVGVFLCYIGAALVYLSPFFDSTGKTQGWHDRAAGTLVIKP
jgi:uncharacterized RDD family membrane protein YckC